MRLIISSPDNFPVLVKKYAPEASYKSDRRMARQFANSAILYGNVTSILSEICTISQVCS
jgi:hypothetical protein